ncbi:GNAT family N-acetyltransferase [Candidatus Bathyarchaeota archaeon]|nr:GNAT family N-acetyltransferase [Candidatus Bathyarchaeota archaeon]
MDIREYQLSDIPAILEISRRTWGGYDQLPYELDELIANPNSFLYVIEYKGRIVAFANLNVIDGGKTGWLEHMRVHFRYRKRGFAWAMTQHLLAEAEARNLNRVRLTTAIENEATRQIATQIGMHQVLQMKLFWKGNYRGIRWKDDSVPIRACNSDEAYDFLNANPDLTTDGIVVYYWHAFDLTRELFSSLSNKFRFWRTEETGQGGALAFGYSQIFHDAPMWASTIYALDVPSFYSALSHQLQVAKEEQAEGMLCFHSPPFQAGGEIPGLKRGTFASSLVLFEKRRPFLSLQK